MISTGICRWLFLLISLSTWTRLIDSKEMRVVCYYTNWSIYRPGQAKFSPQNINPYLCTHLIYAFGGFTKENTLKPFDKYQDIEKGGYAKFTGLKTYNKNLKTLIAIGGWNEGSSRFSPMVASADRRKELVKNAIKFLRQNHFDGLDLDWEYPSFRDGGKPRDRDNYGQLVKELREEFERESEKTGRPRLLLTMAVPAGIEYINKGYDIPKLTKYLDWMNILSYDYHSAYEPAVNHHAPLYSLEEENEYNYDTELNIDYTIKHYLKLGADPNKLVLGIPTYGRSYTLFNPDAYEIGSPADGPGDMGEYTRENGYLAYYEICEYIKHQEWEVEEPNSNAMGPIAFKGNQWVGYDDENIVRKKAEYVVENQMGGIMFWAIDNDDFRGNCHGKPYPLIEAAKEAMLNAYGITDENLISPPSKPTKGSKRKSKTSTTTEQPDDENSVKPSRRRRIKNKSQTEERTSGTSKRRKSSSRKAEETSYSSLKISTPAYTTPEPPATPDMAGGFKCEDEGFFPHPKDCKKYYWCLNGAGDTGIVAHQFTCPAGLYFNKAADSCDYSQNVLCNKKLQKSAASTKEKESTTKASTTENSIFSSSRVPPKITAATSKTTVNFRTTSTTTESHEDDDEYEYEDEEYEPNKKEEPEEDPKVIKELFDLIRKAGGIEELEKQLKLGKSGQTSSSSDLTTPSAISKSIFERVLSKTSKGTLNAFKRTSTNRNSGGPQGGEEIDKKVDRGRPQYKILSRERSTTEKVADAEPEEEKEDPKERKSFKTKSSLEYVNIRRPKASTTTEASEDDSFKRNRILGETEFDENDEEPNTQKSNFPQYVNIRRQRPSTTASPESDGPSEYTSIRRTTDSSLELANVDDQKYKVLRRGTTTSEPSNKGDDENRRRSTTSPKPLAETSDKIESKYSIIRRSTTPSTVEDSKANKNQTIGLKSTITSNISTTESTSVGTTSTEGQQQESSDNVTETDLPESQTINRINSITENVITSTHVTESNSGSSISATVSEQQETKKKRPTLYQPRPFSIGSKPEPTTTTTTAATTSKVSQSFKFRVRPTTTSSTTSNTEPSPTTVRTRPRTRYNKLNRNLNEDSEQEEKYERTVENKPTRSRKRVAAPVDFNEEYERKYRPVELADLSSLTAVDLRGGFVSKHRRRRPANTLTTSERPLDETEKTGPRTITLARKALNQATFGKGRKVVDDQVNEQTSTRKIVRTFRTTTSKPELDISTKKRTRKVIRKFRPSSTTSTSLEDISLNSVEFSSPAPQRKRIPIFRPRASSTTEAPLLGLFKPRFDVSNNNQTDDEPGDILNGEEDENIKLSESNIRESSHINTFDFDEKPGKLRFGKAKDVKPEEEQSVIYGDKLETTIFEASTDIPRILRTRKIIRKLTTASGSFTPTSTDSQFIKDYETKKHAFRGRTTAFQSLSDSLQDDKATVAKKSFTLKTTTTEEPNSSPSSIRLSLYTRHTSTTTTPSPIEEEDEEELNNNEEEDNTTTEEDSLKYTLYTSSVGRSHKFESKTNFNDEDDNKTVNSSVLMSAVNTRNESETIMHQNQNEAQKDSEADLDPVVTTEAEANIDITTETVDDANIATTEDTTDSENNTFLLITEEASKAPATEFTTEYQLKSTLKSIKNRPRFGFTRTTIGPKLAESKAEGSTKRTFSRGFVKSGLKKPITEVTRGRFGVRTSPLPLNRVLNKYSTTRRSQYTSEINSKEEEEEDEEIDFETLITTARITNKPIDSRSFKAKFTKTIDQLSDPKNLNDLDVDTEAIKARNKNLFSQRKMNIPALRSSTEEVTVEPESTEPALTTLHHIFAEVAETETTTEAMVSSSITPESSSKVERLIEVNRIVQVNQDPNSEIVPTVDKIGEISRITLIKIVDGNNNTVVIKYPGINEIDDVNVADRSKIEGNLPSSKVNKDDQLKNIEYDVKLDANGEREVRKFEIFGDSKIANSKDLTNSAGKLEIINGISHINVVTPKPLLVTEASTISLQGLFQTEKPHLNPSFTTNDEVLEAGLSEFVNVRVLNQNDHVKTNNEYTGSAKFIPIRVLNPDEEEITIKAHVMEISPRPDSRKIRIIPIKVEMARSVRVPHKRTGEN